MYDTGKTDRSEKKSLETLKEILLREDRRAIAWIKDNIENPELLKQHISPIIEDRLNLLKTSFPQEYDTIIDQMVENKLQASQEKLLEVIYPVMGKMIRKYINHQLQLIKDQVDETIKSAFGTQGLLWRIKSVFLGVKSSDQVLHHLKSYVVEEVYIIQHHSGLLMGCASAKEIIDHDAIAGMLTAIKSFVEDAFRRKQEELELIEYGTYKILIHNLYSHYIAIAVSGSLNSAERDSISEQSLNFAEKHLRNMPPHPERDSFQKISKKLEEVFLK